MRGPYVTSTGAFPRESEVNHPGLKRIAVEEVLNEVSQEKTNHRRLGQQSREIHGLTWPNFSPRSKSLPPPPIQPCSLIRPTNIAAANCFGPEEETLGTVCYILLLPQDSHPHCGFRATASLFRPLPAAILMSSAGELGRADSSATIASHFLLLRA